MKDDLAAGYVYMEISAARAYGTIAADYIVFGDGRCGDGVFDSATVAACIVGDNSLYFRHDGELCGAVHLAATTCGQWLCRSRDRQFRKSLLAQAIL